MSTYFVFVNISVVVFTEVGPIGSIPVSGTKATPFSDDPRMVLKARRVGIRARSFVSAQP